MPPDGAITFRNMVGKLTVLRVTCDKCGRSGQYRVERLVMRYGIDAKLFDWSDEITADGPRKQAMNLSDRCGARCPDLPKVVSERLRTYASLVAGGQSCLIARSVDWRRFERINL